MLIVWYSTTHIAVKKYTLVDCLYLKHDDSIMDSNKTLFTENDLRQLEQRIDQLIETVGSLKNENSSLRQQQEKLVIERSQLLDKTETARTRVEAMIIRLQSLELNS